MKLKYNQKVKITGGFYEWMIGKVVKEWNWFSHPIVVLYFREKQNSPDRTEYVSKKYLEIIK